ncbi:ribonuclease T2 [Durotheca rogersii]|uniref:ribonuclease T2 n=1 Tax=Durotheca rogersii TaxID=419775 RepID=UPI00222085CF|nr:ribonuclease T2 [Durotheca rogersii]KAI5865363.1 ribonuclease T2 [Durotheca rogersii]
MAPSASLRSAFTYATNFVSQFPLGFPSLSNPFSLSGPQAPIAADRPVTPYDPFTGSPSCPLDGPASCHNTTQADSCCFVYPGGRLLLTQFWDDKIHVGGSEDDWTLHGLWPDLCDGSYDQYCGMTPRVDNITGVLEQYGQQELVADMNRYWVANYGTNEHLWAHEYNKHASCINTLAPSCYGEGYAQGVEVVDYFSRAFGLFKMLDTYRALQNAGIEPSYQQTYPLAKMQAALEKFSGGRVVLRCSGRHRNVLHEAWYVYFVKGSLQSGLFVPAQDSFKGDSSNCAAQVRYLPKRRR